MMALIRNRGQSPVSIGGIPIGPLPAFAPLNQLVLPPGPAPRDRGEAQPSASRDGVEAQPSAQLGSRPLAIFELTKQPVPSLGQQAVAYTANVRPGTSATTEPRLTGKFVALPSLLNEREWVWLGPNRVGGRVRSILIHPTEPELMWTGGVAGGVFRSDDGGKTWATSYQMMGSLVVSCMTLHPWYPYRLYAGTGEGFYNVDAFRGAGIFVSDDAARSWAQLPSTKREEFRWVNRIAMTRSAPRQTFMLVATRAGLFRSEDDGRNFVKVNVPMDSRQLPAFASEVLDVHFHPNDPMRCVAAGRGGNAFYSEDGGKIWHAAAGIPIQPGFGGRVELCYAQASPKDAARPTVVYASADWCDGQVFRSLDGGKTFMLRANLKHMKYPDPDTTPGQGWYDNTLWAGDPRNPNILVVGGIALHRSRDGGRTFVPISSSDPAPNTPHTDQHVIVAVPGYDGETNRAVYIGNDGGIFRTDDVMLATPARGWKAMNNGLAITQFYGAGVNPTSGQIVAGAQDNDTRLYTPGPGGAPAIENWKVISGGDGGQSSADPEKPIFYGEYVTLQLLRSTGGAEAESIYDGITDAGDEERALFIAPATLDPNRPGAMAAGGANLWYVARRPEGQAGLESRQEADHVPRSRRRADHALSQAQRHHPRQGPAQDRLGRL